MKTLYLKFSPEQAGKVAAALAALGICNVISWSKEEWFNERIYLVAAVTEEQAQAVDNSDLVTLKTSL